MAILSLPYSPRRSDYCTRNILVYHTSTTSSIIDAVILRLHPTQLLPHVDLVPVFGKTVDFAVLDLENGGSAPFGMSSGCFDAIMRLATVTTFGGVSQQNVTVFCPCLVELDDVKIRDGAHNFGVRVGVVERCLAAGECGWRKEPGVVCAEVLDRVTALVLFRRVSDAHVLLCDLDVLLFGC